VKHSKRKRSGRKYNRGRAWIQRRDAAFERAGGICEVSGKDLFTVTHGEDCDGSGKNCENFDDGYCRYAWRRAAHHIVAERFARRWVPGCDVHSLENLIVVTNQIHAQLTRAEDMLFDVDVVRYKQELNRIGLVPERFDRAMQALCASVRKSEEP
jgi:hypothetical protein